MAETKKNSAKLLEKNKKIGEIFMKITTNELKFLIKECLREELGRKSSKRRIKESVGDNILNMQLRDLKDKTVYFPEYGYGDDLHIGVCGNTVCTLFSGDNEVHKEDSFDLNKTVADYLEETDGPGFEQLIAEEPFIISEPFYKAIRS